jgi:hypothetical protein
MTAVLLVETATGDVVAVRFPDTASARAWEDLHEHEVTAHGCPKVITPHEALRLARGAA